MGGGPSVLQAQSQCQVFPYGQKWQDMVYPKLDSDICDDFNSGETITCASSLEELYCLVREAEENGCKKVQVCSGTTIYFDAFGALTTEPAKRNGEYNYASLSLQLPDKMKIECAGCECTLERPFALSTYSLCPFFTTQFGNDIYVKGFKYRSKNSPANHNIISYSNHDPDISVNPEIVEGSGYVPNLYNDLDENSKSIQASSNKLKASKCSSGSRGKKECKASSRSSKRGLRFLQDDDEGLFCGNEFFQDDEEVLVGDAGDATADLAADTVADTIIRSDNATVLILPNPDPCSAENNNLVSLFHANDADADGFLTCEEVEQGYSNAGAVAPECSLFFQAIAYQRTCFKFNETDGTLGISAV